MNRLTRDRCRSQFTPDYLFMPIIAPLLFLCSPKYEFSQCARGKTRAPSLLVGLFHVHEICTGNIQMCPLRVPHELFEDFGSLTRGCGSAAGLFDVGNITENILFILVIQGHGPELFTDSMPGSNNLIAEFCIVAEHA